MIRRSDMIHVNDGWFGAINAAPVSFSKARGEVYLVVLLPGGKLRCHGVVAEGGENGAIVIADRVTCRYGKLYCDGYIRQDVKLSNAWREKLKVMQELYPEDGFTQWDGVLDAVNFDTPSYDGAGWRRHLAEERGGIYLEVPGGIHPILERGQAVVCNFSMSGTSYWIVPDKAWLKVLHDAKDKVVYNFNTSCM